jgi:hypothetical protein
MMLLFLQIPEHGQNGLLEFPPIQPPAPKMTVAFIPRAALFPGARSSPFFIKLIPSLEDGLTLGFDVFSIHGRVVRFV